MVETTEGVYLALGKFSVKLTKSDRELKSIHHLLISDSDYKSLNDAKRTTKLVNKLNEHLCHTLKMLIRLYEKQYNKYFVVNDMLSNELVLFNNDGLIVIAECVDNIENIVVIEKMAACFEQPEVYFNLNGMKQHASLFEGGILSRNKDINIDCMKRKISILQDGD